MFFNTIFPLLHISLVFWLFSFCHNIFFQYSNIVPLSALKMDLGSSLIWMPNFFLYVNVYIYIYLPLPCLLFIFRGLNLNCVSREGPSLPKAFQQDRQNDCCVAELGEPLVTGQSNQDANLSLLLCDLFLITFRQFRYAFTPELNKERCVGCDTEYHRNTVALHCA